jgi:hypothetical protein
VVEGVDGHGRLGHPIYVYTRPQPIADNWFPPPNSCLDFSSTVVAGGLLSDHAALPGDAEEVAVALCGPGFSCFAGHRCGAWRHDLRCIGVTFGDVGVNAILIIGAVTRERGQRACDLLERGTNLDIPGERCRICPPQHGF